MISSARYTTADVAAKDRFSYWREAVCDSYVKLGCDYDADTLFEGGIEIARHTSLNVSRVWGVRQSVHRRHSDLRASSDAYFLFSLQTRNHCQLTQGGDGALLRPGDMGLYDSTRPYRLDLTDDFQQTVLQLPADRLLARLPNARLLTGKRIDGQTAMGQLVGKNILAFSEQLHAADDTLGTLLQETLIDLIATGLASAQDSTASLKHPEQQVLLRARSLIAERITDPDLDRETVARGIGLSVRHLNNLFGKEGSSVASEIRRLRLRRVASELRDPRFAHMTISEIALRCGYANLQHFSTAFRKAYDVTPTAYRAGEG